MTLPRRIGVRLGLSFAGIALLVLAGSVVALWQFSRMRVQAQRLYEVELQSVAVLRVHTDVLALPDRIDRLIATRDAKRFSAEVGALRQVLAADTDRAVQALSAAPADAERHAPMLRTLETVRSALPSQIDTLRGLAAAGDWEAVRLRLENQVAAYSSITSPLVEEVDRAVSREEAEARLGIASAQRRFVLTLAMTGVLTLLLAGVLGLAVTRSITRPLARLDEGAQALARGEFQHQVPVLGQDELASLAVVFNDTTRRLRDLYQALRRSEAHFRDMFENAVEGVFQTTPDGRFLTANPSMARTLGYDSPAELVAAATDIETQIYKDPAARREMLRRLEEQGVVQGFECELKRKDGTTVWVAANVRAVRDEAGQVLYLEGTNQDISDRRRAQELQTSLRHNETMSAMGSLLAGVAHEVRNPLFGISANLDAFEAQFGQRPEYAETLTMLRSEVDRLVALMNDLFDFGRPLQDHTVPGSLAEVVGRAVATRQSMAKRAGVEMSNRVPERLPRVLMDRKRLIQAFENVLQNAVQHTPAGGHIVIEAVHENSHERGWLRCTVRDSGPGFPNDDLGAVFQPFFTRRRGGTGLGLAIVQRIVEGHGGQVAAANRPEGGAEVTVRLPCA
jgi:PAS domain S-box-containing protein